jgi:hypothetical protein
MPVRQEPHHKVLFENGYVRLIDLIVAPGDTTLTHIHAASSVVIWMSNSTFGIQNIGEPAVMTKVNAGDVVYRAYGEKPVTHIVWNPDISMFHCMVVELLKQHPVKDTFPIISGPGIKFQWQRELVRAYKLDIYKGRKYNLPASNCASLLLNVSGIAITVSIDGQRSLEAGSYVFLPPQSHIEISESNKENAGCILLELN